MGRTPAPCCARAPTGPAAGLAREEGRAPDGPRALPRVRQRGDDRCVRQAGASSMQRAGYHLQARPFVQARKSCRRWISLATPPCTPPPCSRTTRVRAAHTADHIAGAGGAAVGYAQGLSCVRLRFTRDRSGADTIQKLISLRADANMRSRNGSSALMIAERAFGAKRRLPPPPMHTPRAKPNPHAEALHSGAVSDGVGAEPARKRAMHSVYAMPYSVPHVACRTSHFACRMSHVACRMLHVAPHVVC